jgi:PncC family amidohydrolase
MNYAQSIGDILIKRNSTISTVESCTGGLLSSKLTDISGSSAYISFNLVTYANDIKIKILGVNPEIIETYGVVSEECSLEMAKGLYSLTGSNICVSTTGIAGPTGGSLNKPVGLMYSTIFSKDKYKSYKIIEEPSTPRIIMKEKFANTVLKNIYDFLI